MCGQARFRQRCVPLHRNDSPCVFAIHIDYCVYLFLLQRAGQGLKQGTQESISMLVKENVRGGRLIPIQKGEALVRTPGTSFDLDCHLEPGRDPEVEVSWWVNARRFRNKSRAKVRIRNFSGVD